MSIVIEIGLLVAICAVAKYARKNYRMARENYQEAERLLIEIRRRLR